MPNFTKTEDKILLQKQNLRNDLCSELNLVQ
jgi:hypothetical protein